MPSESMAIDMRHTKLKASEAAILAGEVQKPSWQSKNEGIHEKVSFEDCIWGFDLAGGSFYKTPLRVVSVKPDSRAEKAGIRKGDTLKRINDIETSTLTIQEAHEIIVDSGIHLRIAVTAPEDEEDAYFCYEDELQSGYDSEEERRKEEEKEKKRHVHAKVSSYWSLQWPWVSKRRIIYRESNCFMVPSKYETSHRDKFPISGCLRTPEDIILQSQKTEKELKEKQLAKENLANGVTNGNEMQNGGANASDVIVDGAKPNESMVNGTIPEVNGINPVANGINGISDEELEKEPIKNMQAPKAVNEDVNSQSNGVEENSTADDIMEVKDDEVINEMLESEETVSRTEEEMILDSILSDGEETLPTSEPIAEPSDER